MLLICYRLEQMLGTLLSTLEGTELLDNLMSVIPQFEKMVGTLVENIQAGNGENVKEEHIVPALFLFTCSLDTTYD